jgi:hypothetical protein
MGGPYRLPSQFLWAQKYSGHSLSFHCIKNSKGIAIMTTSGHNSVHAVSSFAGADEEFEAAWRDPNCTQFALPPLDVNKVLNEHYTVKPPIRFTRSMLWDMVLKKAWDPNTYISYLASDGRSWGRHNLEEGCEEFFRSSVQAAWISKERGQVLENVFIDRNEFLSHAYPGRSLTLRRILSLGRGEMTNDKRDHLYAGHHQPLFHVEHGAGGSESEPLNVWRIVFLTESNDQRFTEPFKQMINSGLLPGFLAIYIERDLHRHLRRL